MAELGLVRWIRDLNENGAVSLARGLLLAECGRRALPLDTFSMTERVKAKDGGVDGRSILPPASAPLFPIGKTIWQIKSGSTPPDAAKELSPKKRAPLRREIAEGSDYVLFWTNDPSDPNLREVERSFRAEIKAIRNDAKVYLLFSDHIERMCRAHPAVMAEQFPFLPLSGVITVDAWAHSEFPSADFQPDPLRSSLLLKIQAHIAGADPPNTLHIFGDTGVGKSRLVYEALKSDGVRQRTLVAPDATNLDRNLLAQTVQSDERSLIVVVDDCDAEQRRALDDYVGMALGRIRLLTIGPRYSRASQPSDLRYLELLPLEAEAAKHIALAVGLDDSDADLVARYTEGYPGLALVLSKSIRYGQHDTSLTDRIRGHEEIGAVLSSLTGEDPVDLEPLGMLALFEKIGYEGDLAQELTLACECLGVDEPRVRALADREAKRFVSTAGRYRNVSPRLFALWAAMRFINDRGPSLGEGLRTLPPSLLQRVLSQMSAFAGDPTVEATIGGLVRDEPFRSGTLQDVSEGAARLLHVAAVVAPTESMTAIAGLLSRATQEDLGSFVAGRRGVVSALEILMWYEKSFETAASALLSLGMSENETWANNATNQLQGIFRIFLGGTEANYDRRIEWARETIRSGGEPAARFLLAGLNNAFDAHESRFGTDFGGAPKPVEWRPSTLADEIAARRLAWGLIVDIGREFESLREPIGTVVAGAARTAIQRGLSDLVLRTVREGGWSSETRVELAEALTHVVEYDEPPADVLSEIELTLAKLRGQSMMEFADFVLAGTIWQLADGREETLSGRPSVLVELARQMRRAPREIVMEIARRSVRGNEHTTSVLFDEVALLGEGADLLLSLERLVPRSDSAVLGMFRGLATMEGDEWADANLQRWLLADQADLVVAAVHGLPTTDSRARLALTAVERKAVPPEALSRFLFGGWTRELSSDVFATLLELLAAEPNERVIESALGMLEQWSEVNDASSSPRVQELGVKLLGLADRFENESAMVGLYRSRLLDRLGLSIDTRSRLLFDHLGSMHGLPDQYDLEPFDRLGLEDPEGTAARTLHLLLSPDHSAMWLQSGHIISRLVARAGVEVVAEAVVATVPVERWHELVGHLDFEAEAPDPIFCELLKRGADDRATERANFSFMYPSQGWTGSESEHLAERLERSARWLESTDSSSPLGTWLRRLRPVIESAIEEARRREAESDW